MAKPITYVGLDVHKDTIAVALAASACGEKCARVEIDIGNCFKEGRATQQHIQCWARLEARSRPGEPSKVLSAGSHPTLETRPRKLRDVSPVRR